MFRTFALSLAAVFAAASACFFPVMATPPVVGLDYSFGSDNISYWGTGREVTYDVAVHIDDPAMVGAYIKGVYVPLAPAGGSISENVSVWVASRLALDAEGVNVADIAKVEGQLSGAPAPRKGETPEEEPYISLQFPDKVRIPEGGVYVGYTLTVTGLHNYTQTFPHQLVTTDRRGGLYVHDTRKYTDWTDYGAESGKASSMKIMLDIIRSDWSVSPAVAADTYMEMGKESTIKVQLVNHGIYPIENISYTYKFEDGEALEEKTLAFAEPLEGTYGALRQIELPLPERLELGRFPYTLEITKVNGQPNADNVKETRSVLNVLDFMPVTRPLLEDVTGFWCAGCASSYVKLKEMHDLYPDLVAVSIHNKDQIAAVPSVMYPFSVNSFPSFWINRKIVGRGAFDSEWEEEMNKLAPAAVYVEAEWADDGHTRLKAHATSRFIADTEDADYRMACVLIGDGMSDPAWGQRNSYSGNTALTGKYWEPFVNGGHQVYGLVYDDIALIYSSMDGEPGSVPSSIKAGERYSVDFDFDLEDAVCNFDGGINYGNNIVKDKNLLRVVAYVYDAKSGRVVNSTVSPYMGESGITPTVAGNSDIVATYWYDLQGRRILSASEPGIYILVEIQGDGTRKAKKVRI